MTTYKPIDSKREEFRKYLERTGVMDALTRALVSLYEETEKPEDALAYVRSRLGGSVADEEKVKSLQKENDELKGKLARLQGRQSAAVNLMEKEAAQKAAAAKKEAEGPAAGEGQPEPLEEEDEGTTAAGDA